MTALLTDHYELAMLRTFVADGIADSKAVFEVFARNLPRERAFGLLAGTGRAIEPICLLRFTADEIDWLREQDIVDRATAEYLSTWRFTGRITGYREGDLYLPHSPVLTVEATLGEGVLLETFVLSVLNHDTAVASAAARMVLAAAGAGLVEMGSRRTHEWSAVAAARAAHIAGFDSTSNLQAGHTYGIVTAGTAAHAFVLAYPSEIEAFRSQIADRGPETTLLVDTYDTTEGVRRAIEAGGPDLGAIRLDSGDLAQEALRARSALDAAGNTRTRIVATGDLDEHLIDQMVRARAPVDAFGVGTALVAGSSHLTPGFVYKLVAVEDPSTGRMRPVAKQSIDKNSTGGHKSVRRGLRDGRLVAERFAVDGQDIGDLERALAREGLHHEDPTITYVADGEPSRVPSIDQARALAATSLAVTLPEHARSLDAARPFALAHRHPTTVA